MSKIESPGVYVGEILESGITETTKHFPQWTAKVKVLTKYVDEPAELTHFQLTEPQYVDYSAYDQDTTVYLVLFNDAGELFHYADLQKATGWDGQKFEDLANLVGKQIMLRVENDEYQGKTSLKVRSVDAPDASPVRSLKVLDSAGAASLSARFLTKKAAPKVASAAPKLPVATAPKTAPKPVAAPVPTPAIQTALASAPAAVATPAPASATPAPAVKAPKAKAPPKAAAAPTAAVVTPEQAKMNAWNQVNTIKGTNSDDVLGTAWQEAVTEVATEFGEAATEAMFTVESWSKVAAIVTNDLNLKAV